MESASSTLNGVSKYSKCIADCPRVCKNKTSGVMSYFYYGGRKKKTKRCWQGGRKKSRRRRGGSAFNVHLNDAAPFANGKTAQPNTVVNGSETVNLDLVQQAGWTTKKYKKTRSRSKAKSRSRSRSRR